ncbi:hypothetical protein B0J11DRAFT_294331 [Dendryphion nanum]|uniref:DUF7730 domain-containing protein n=1 Tax=Dendryphion nanum TaxID=256645 RepID=A0A9P9INH7_9PLEO|nr:hypothetical protein B0J11DRAFT_294331 [Dendryphion nanum]
MEFRGAVKRTYSRRNLTTKPSNHNGQTNPNDRSKRRKKDILSGSQSQPLNTINSMPNKSWKNLGSPLSNLAADEEAEVQPSIHGGFKAFKEQISKSLKGKKIQPSDVNEDTTIRSAHPSSFTNPNNKAQGGGELDPSTSKVAGCGKIQQLANAGASGFKGLGMHVRKPSIKSLTNTDVNAAETNTDSTVVSASTKMVKNSYQTKQYEAEKSPAPSKSVRKGLLDPVQVKLWERNQEKSPFLRLPAELRNLIYELILGNNTILILRSPPFKGLFHYKVQVQERRHNPFAQSFPSKYKTTWGFPVLSGLCRQLYLETHRWPFKNNTWAFPRNLTMWNYFYHSPKLTQAQMASIEELCVLEELPSENLLRRLSGLKVVQLTDSWSCDDFDDGYYVVERDEKGVRLVKGREKATQKH